MSWKQRIAEQAGAVLENVEELVDVRWRGFTRQMGFGKPRAIVPYRGYGNGERLWVTGRLLANKPTGGPRDDDGWWDNLKATYNRWESDEVPGAELELEYAGSKQRVTTDDEGYYTAEFEIAPQGPRADTVLARHDVDDRSLAATHDISHLDADARLLIISDMDDTVIHTGITNLLVAAQLTFLNNAKTRKPLTGVGSLYRALTQRGAEDGRNPIFYLSNSAWNMYDLLRDFLSLNDLPSGPLMLRDLGLGTDSSSHKADTLRQVLDRFPDLPVVLVGDSGQHDASIYADLAAEHPARIRAIYIRDVDPTTDNEYDSSVDAIIERTRAVGVPFLRVRDSAAIARHAAEIGLLEPSTVADIERDVAADAQRDTLAEETIG